MDAHDLQTANLIGDPNVDLTIEPTETAKGKRVFTVSLGDGKPVTIDIVAKAGAGMTATTLDLPAAVTDGMLRLSFEGKVGEALVSAIDVVGG